MNQKRMINNRMQKINENTFGIWYLVRQHSDFLSGAEMSHTAFLYRNV